MFDPFGDYQTKGYLRNKLQLFDPCEVKQIEHSLFSANIISALDFLESLNEIEYKHFLTVHEILFSDFYPWAGQDRNSVAPTVGINKGNTEFAHPQMCERAVTEGLRLAQYKRQMREKPGTIMGFFAYGHPFLDGNGRTMLLVHTVLANRAGFSIEWQHTDKADYLRFLDQEIQTPDKGILDNYLKKFIGEKVEFSEWGSQIPNLKGLDGLEKYCQDDDANLRDLNNSEDAEKQHQYEVKREYKFTSLEDSTPSLENSI